MLTPAYAQRPQPRLFLPSLARFYSGLPHQDRALSLLQDQIDKSNPELLQADSIAANVWRDSATLVGHEDILGGIAEGNHTGQDPLAMALSIANVRPGAPVDIEVLYDQAELPSEAMVTITREGFLDDSVDGSRYRFDMEKQGEQWTITRAGRQFRCQPGRGQQDWAAGFCS